VAHCQRSYLRSIIGISTLSRDDLVILKLIRAHLVFVGQSAQAHLQDRISAVASEAAASVGLFSKYDCSIAPLALEAVLLLWRYPSLSHRAFHDVPLDPFAL
jgi:hypothetical protein